MSAATKEEYERRNQPVGYHLISQGKVRDVYQSDRGSAIALVASDRVSAFDSVIGDVEIPGKGQILTRISSKWCDYLAGAFDIKTAMVATSIGDATAIGFPGPKFAARVTIQRKLRMFPIEFIVRGFITGSAWKDYENGRREICGEELPDYLLKSQQFLMPIFTPTTKAAQGHDENITFGEMIKIIEQNDLCADNMDAADTAEELRELSLIIYDRCFRYALRRGIIIADTKFEFGLNELGFITLADEVMTPDSSRFWPLNAYRIGEEQKSLDKQIIRDYIAEQKSQNPGQPIENLPPEIIAQTAAAYAKVSEMLFG